MEDHKKVKKRRTPITKEQLNILVKRYNEDNYIKHPEILSLSQAVGLTEDNVRTWFKNRRSADKRRSKSLPLLNIQQDYSPNADTLNLSDDYQMIQSHHGMDAIEPNFIPPYQNKIWISENQYASANVPIQSGTDHNFDLFGTQPSNGYAYWNVDNSQMRVQSAYDVQCPNVNHPNSWQHPQGNSAQHQYRQASFQQTRNYGYYQVQQNQAPMYYQQNTDHNQIPSYQFFPMRNHNSGSFDLSLESNGNGGPSM